MVSIVTLTTARELSEAYRSGAAHPSEVVHSALETIARLNPEFNWFISVLSESALASARESDVRFREGNPLGPLDGIPVAVKDIIYIKGVKCTAGSKILADTVAPYDSPLVARLRAGGAVILGTTNLHEFAAGVTSANPHYGPVRNPWDPSRVAGGSSGGSAAAVAGGVCPAALGTDTAGSVRIPAALCGVVGLKPTYGRVSRLGVIPLASSLDVVGTLSAGVWDAAVLLRTLSGGDPGDITTSAEPVPDYVEGLTGGAKGFRVGVPEKYFQDLLDPAVQGVFARALGRLKELGCPTTKADLDGIEEVYDRWLAIRRAEATAFHLRWLDSSPELYGDDVRALLELGKDVRAVDYVEAVNSRPTFIERFLASMKDVDFLAVPSTCIPAPQIGRSRADLGGKETEVYHALNRLTLPFNYVGFPAVTLPAGESGGLPLGFQLVGKLFDEARLLALAHSYEREFGPFPSPRLPG